MRHIANLFVNVGLFWIVLSDRIAVSGVGFARRHRQRRLRVDGEPESEGWLLIQYAGNDVDEWGQCLIPQIGHSRSAAASV